MLFRSDIEWEQLGTHDEHLSVLDYKKVQRFKEVKAIEKTLSKLEQKQVDVQVIEAIEAKPVPFSSKVTLSQEEYKTLATAAKKYAVQEKKERKLQKLLDAANKKIAQLEAKIAELLKNNAALTKHLDQFRSIRGQLDNSKLKPENMELRQQNSFLKSILEQHGLSHLLGRGREQQKQESSKHGYMR